MDLGKIRTQVYNAIRRSFTEADFLRAKEKESPLFLPYEIYNDFLREQMRIIKLSPEAQLERYRIAVEDVNRGMIQTVDLDSMVVRTGRIVYT